MRRHNICLVVVLLSQLSGSWSYATARNESRIQSRIVGGTDADINNVQFVVSVRLRSLEEDIVYGAGLVCGGSLISDNVVLTASHCVFDHITTKAFGKPKDYVVVMGNLDTDNTDDHTLQFNVKSFVRASYNEEFKYDIALIFLDGRVPEGHPTAKPIPLINGPLKDGITCHTYGWGILSNGEFPTILQAVDLPFITHESCAANSFYAKDLGRGVICAGDMENGGIGGCQRDSGGPLVCGGIQVGVNAWGYIPCGQPRQPTVFTHVLKFRRWIKKHVHTNGGTQPKFVKLKNTV